MVPRCDFACLGFFNKYVFMKHARGLGCHEVECGLSDRAGVANLFKLWNSLPVDVVVKESTACASWCVFISPRARGLHVGQDPLPQLLKCFRRNKIAQYHHTISFVSRNKVWVKCHAPHASCQDLKHRLTIEIEKPPACADGFSNTQSFKRY